MSAWIVEKDHIDLLIAAGLRLPHQHDNLRWDGGRLTHSNADEVGQMLWDANHLSVNVRYNEATPTPDYRYRAPRMPRGIDPVMVLKALDSYEYQTCEFDGYYTSEAHRFCDALRRTAIHRLDGYDEAPWAIAPEHLGRRREGVTA